MRPERWQKLDALLDAALSVEAEQRAAFLDQECAGDEELRREIDSLLAVREPARGFLEAGPATAAVDLLARWPQALSAGQQLGPYTVASLLGRGGMSEVYLAQDARLGRNVALKVLGAEFTGNPVRARRFEQEARAVSALNHPNILTIHDIGQLEGIPFIATELIEGQTLRQRLGGNRMTLGEAIEVALQVSGALSAAHRAGIVHRDIKPENIMLRSDGYIKVLDFGLAKLLGPPPAAALETGSGMVLGTARYMSPEQARAQPVDARTDVFSLGVVLYEMLTGRAPFDGETPSHVIVSLLETEPPPLARYWAEAPAELQQIVDKALQKSCEARYQSVEQLAADLRTLKRRLETGGELDRTMHPASSGQQLITETLEQLAGQLGKTAAARKVRDAERRGRRIGRPGLAWSLLVLGLLALAGIGTYSFKADRGGPETGAIQQTRSVAVVGFKNLSGNSEKAWLSTAVSEMLAADLGAGQKLRILSGEAVAQTKRALELPELESFDPQSLARIRQSLGVEAVIAGSYLSVGQPGAEKLSLVFRLQDTARGETLASLKETGSEAELFELIDRAGVGLRVALGIRNPSAAEAETVLASLPSNLEAARLYVEGLARLRRSDLPGARDFLEKAVAADPDFVFAHSAMARAWKELGYEQKARAEARRALDLSAGLSREARLLVEGDYREAATEWEKAAEIYRTLFELHPDNVDYGLRLASAQGRIYSREAYATLEALRRLPPPAGSQLQIDLTEIDAASWMSDFQRLLAAAARAVEKARAQDAWLLVARALGRRCWALLNLGEPDAALAACEEARQIQAEKGDRSGLARTLSTIAILHLDGGDLPQAQRLTEEALAIYREVGNQHWVILMLGNLGDVLYDQGELAGARKVYEEAVAALRTFAEHRSGLAMGLGQLGNVLRQQGELAGARKAYEEAMELGNEPGLRRWRADALAGIGALLLAEADLEGARRAHEEALQIRAELDDQAPAGRSRLALAGLDLEQGRATQAEAGARQAVEEFRGKKPADDEALAFELLARALLAQDRPTEARKAASSAAALAQERKSPPTRLPVLVTAARARAAEPAKAEDVNEAIGSLEAMIAEAARVGLYGLQLEARLALGEIELLAFGRADAGRARLDALEREAQARGYGLIARKAAAARKPGR